MGVLSAFLNILEKLKNKLRNKLIKAEKGAESPSCLMGNS